MKNAKVWWLSLLRDHIQQSLNSDSGQAKIFISRSCDLGKNPEFFFQEGPGSLNFCSKIDNTYQ